MASKKQKHIPKTTATTIATSTASTPSLTATTTKTISEPILTKYEKAQVIAVRAEQISNGSPTFIELDGTLTDPRDIARAELFNGKIPFIIKRTLPNGKHESFKLQELLITDTN